MYAQLQLQLSHCNFGWWKGSALQGVLFEHIDFDYADRLHTFNLHPYSQYLYKTQEKVVWVINTLNDESYEKIIDPLLKSNFSGFKLKQGNEDVEISEKICIRKGERELLNEFYQKPAERHFSVEIATPAAFKHAGAYTILPEPWLFFQSLMNKYSAASETVDLMDEKTLEELDTKAVISRYRLHSAYYPLEGIKIPGFAGEMDFYIRGTETMARFVRLLLNFGEFSGIGVKTAMGMGAIRRIRKEHHNHAENNP